MTVREVKVSPHAGFCFGVKRAIKIAQEQAEAFQSLGRPVYTCGPLIHNKRVIGDLSKNGVLQVDGLEQVPEQATVIVRSHGEPKSFYQEAARRGIALVDATCPFVARIHELVQEAEERGQQVIIVGDANHAEVTATQGFAQGAWVLDSKAATVQKLATLSEEACQQLREGGIFLVAQTTIRRQMFTDVQEALQEKGFLPEVVDTICSATNERQEACRETAQWAEAMIVIGDSKSSNSRKLYEIASQNCEKAYFIENLRDLPLKEMESYNKIGVAAGASTPAVAIEEVLNNMSENTPERELTMQELMESEEFEKSLRLPRSGDLVTGTVITVSEKEIYVNLGCKKDGIIPSNEVPMEDGQKLVDLFKEGDEIDAKVLKTDDGEGSILLSRRKMKVGEHWKEINQALEDKTAIQVEVVRPVNGGVIASYKEVSGFIPMSQLSDRYVEDSSEFVGRTLNVKVSRVDPRRNKAVFSHKAYLNEQRQKAMEEIWQNIQVGDIVEGTVMRFTDYGAFVDIGGIDGLLHISEISWGKLKHPQEVLSVGEKIRVKVLSMSAEKGKISLGLKQTIPEPWSVIDENYNVGDVVEGKVVQIKEYGCFVELDPGLDGLVHISEVSHKRVANINDELSIGDMVNTKILEIDKDRRRISLSIKETMTAEEEEAMKATKADAAPAEEVEEVEEA